MKTNLIAVFVLLVPMVIALGCAQKRQPAVALVRELNNHTNPPMVVRNSSGTLGTIERLDPALDQLLAADAKLEILAEGVDWCEGPVWRDGGVFFSDVKQNTIYRWTPKVGVAPYLKPSGYLQATPRGGEPGSNGLTLDHKGRLVMCQHGERRVARLEKDGSQTAVADRYQGKRFNSPNDLCFDSKGNLYFTDPPYGLEKQNADPKKELDFNGVYLLKTSGELVRTPADVKYPNGIALSPDEKTLYVCVSDPKNPVIMKYDVQADGNISGGKVFFDASPLFARKLPGLPDGLKVDTRGDLWATAPGGVLIISPKGQHLGTIATGQPTANCGWGDDGSTLYVCANHNFCRIRTKAKGSMPGVR